MNKPYIIIVHVSKIHSLLSKLSKVEATALHPVLSISACFIILGPQHSVHPSRTVVRNLSIVKIRCMSIQSYINSEPLVSVYICSYVCITLICSARNNSRPLTIFRPISAFGQPKSILIGHISHTFSMGQQCNSL